MIRLSNLITEVNGTFTATNKKSGKTSAFDSEEARDMAVKVGTHTSTNDTKDTKSVDKNKEEPKSKTTKKDKEEIPTTKSPSNAKQKPPSKAQLFTADPAMAARMGKEKETQTKLAADTHSADGHSSDKGNAGWRKNAKTAVTKPKVYARAIKDGIKDWKDEEKEFFKEKVHKGDTPARRSWGQALKDKAVGAWAAIKKGAKHEVETFKKAGEGVMMWANGMPLTDEQTDAMKSVVKKVVVAGVIGVATGGLGHGVMPFVTHLMAEFIPHIVGETIIAGVAKAAVFAGPVEMGGGKEEEAIQKFMDVIGDKMAKEDIPLDILAMAIQTYNAGKKDGGITQNEAKLAVNQLQQLVKESIIR